MNDHGLFIRNDGSAECACGETFHNDAPSKTLREWQDHVEVAEALLAVRLHALAERKARADMEATIVRLVDLGISSRVISEAAGTDGGGTLLVSPTLVQRLGRGEHVLTPRRRRRS